MQTPTTKKSNSEDLVIPERISTYEDKKTGARSVALPVDFPDGKHGAVIISRLDDSPWKPSDDIEKITVVFK